MHFSLGALVSTLLAGQVSATALSQVHHAVPRHNHAHRHVEMQRAAAAEKTQLEQPKLADRGVLNLLSKGLSTLGLNAIVPSTSTPWLGSTGDITNTFHNNGTDDLYLVIWGVAGSWVNVIQPSITVLIPSNSSKTVSFPLGSSGAWSALYNDTSLVNGQISETWGEYTFNNEWSTVDVSREVNMAGRNMRIVTPQCVSDMKTCVFVCPSGQKTCMYGYELQNCTVGSQPGANYGTFLGSPSGGCSGIGTKANLTTYLNYK